MGVPNRLNSVPRRMLPIYKKVVDAIDEVCGNTSIRNTMIWRAQRRKRYVESAQALSHRDTHAPGRAPSSIFLEGSTFSTPNLVSAHDDDRPMCRIWSWRKDSPHQGASDRRCAPNQAREG